MNVGDAGSLVDPDATIVVTRPEPDAARLVARLAIAGRRAFALPLLAIEATPDQSTLRAAMTRIDDAGLVVFVSPNAIRHALGVRAAPWPAAVPIGVMGPGSVEALAALGIAPPAYRVIAPAANAGDEGGGRFDSEALFAALDEALALSRGGLRRATIVRGNGGRGWLAERLRAAGIAVAEVEAYRRTRGVPDRAAVAALRALYTSGARAAFALTSSEAVAHLGPVVVQALSGEASADTVRAWLAGATLIVPHRRIAEAARAAGYTRLAAAAPGDRGIVASIE